MDTMDVCTTFEKNVDISKDYKQLCRFCFVDGASKKIDAKSLELFKLLTNVELICTPEYPKSICSVCESQLKSFYKFRVSLIEIERCWKQFFDYEYLEFIKSIHISEEHIYDEIFLEIEMDAEVEYEDTVSLQSFDRSSVPLIKGRKFRQSENPKASFRQHHGVKFVQFHSREYFQTEQADNGYYDILTSPLTVSKNDNCDIALNLDQHQRNVYVHRPQYSKIIQNFEEPFTRENQTYYFQEFPHQSGPVLQAPFTKRNHDIVSLSSFERVNKSLTEKNKLHKRKTRVSNISKKKIKCVVVGDGAVGKTNLILSYLENKFIDRHIPTASDIYTFEVKVNKRPVQVTLCDTAGQDSLDRLRQLSYPDCDVFLLCFSVVNPESFDSIKLKWAPTFLNTKASLVLVGTQADLRSNLHSTINLKKRGLCPVYVSDACDLAQSIGAEFIETSSRNNLGVKTVFDTAIESALYGTETEDSITSSFWKKLFCLA